MTKQLTRFQYFKHYSIVWFLLILPILEIFLIIRNGIKGYLLFHDTMDIIVMPGLFLLAAITFYLIKKNQLTFKEYNIDCSKEEFETALKLTAENNEWEINKIDDNHIVATQRIVFSTFLMITILRKRNKLYLNCINDPETWSSGLTFGWRKKNIDLFLANLEKTQNDLPITGVEHKKWGIFDYILRIVAYPTCLFMMVMSVYMIRSNENVLFGILLGLLGLGILISDLRVIISKIKAGR